MLFCAIISTSHTTLWYFGTQFGLILTFYRLANNASHCLIVLSMKFNVAVDSDSSKLSECPVSESNRLGSCNMTKHPSMGCKTLRWKVNIYLCVPEFNNEVLDFVFLLFFAKILISLLDSSWDILGTCAVCGHNQYLTHHSLVFWNTIWPDIDIL